MSKAERIQVDCRVDNPTPGKNIRRFGQDSCLAGSHCARNDQQRFRKLSIALRSFHAFTASTHVDAGLQSGPRIAKPRKSHTLRTFIPPRSLRLSFSFMASLYFSFSFSR